jgi:hypothetical protein
LTKAIDADQSRLVGRDSPPQSKASIKVRTHSPNAAPAPTQTHNEEEGEEEDDDFGPALPSQHNTLTHSTSTDPSRATSRNPGPTHATLDDIRAHHEAADSSTTSAHAEYRHSLQQSRKHERTLQAERLEDLVPRAAPGTRERQLEKRRDAAASNRAFAASAHEAGDADLKDADVMGEADSLGDLKRMKKENERKKNERELRREEVLRARRAEREARLAVVREKEERTMGMLRELAQARFGGGGTADEGG